MARHEWKEGGVSTLTFTDLYEMHDMACVWGHTNNMNVKVEFSDDTEDASVTNFEIEESALEDLTDEERSTVEAILDILEASVKLHALADRMVHDHFEWTC